MERSRIKGSAAAPLGSTSVAKARIRLRGVSPQLESKIWETQTQLRLGRYEHLEIVLNDPSISRRHAEIVHTEQGWIVRDQGSTNGTFLNGVRVGRTDRKIRQRDVLQCGNLVMVVQLLEDDVPEAQEQPGGSMQVQATTSQTWDKALESIAFDEKKRPRAGDRLVTLLRASHHLTHVASLETLLRSILDDAVAALDAQRGSIVLVDDKSGNLNLRAVSTGEAEVGGRVAFSRSLAQRCFTKSESLLCKDVNTSPELLIANSIADGAMASIICAVLRSPRKKLGVLHLDRGPLQEAFSMEDLWLADALAASVSAAIESAQLVEKQRDLFLQTVTALAQAVELRDKYTGGHTQRVTDYSLILADALSLSPEERRTIQMGTPLHDIGKIGIDDAVLRKPARLSPDEFEQMKKHTTMGAAIIESIPDLAPVLPIVRNHHEAWDGSGYPDAFGGEQIPFLARIVAVADAFDAMTSSRPYRPAMPTEKAFEQIREGMGKQFDPGVAQAFIKHRHQVEEARSERLAAEIDAIAFPDDGSTDGGPPTASLKENPANSSAPG